LWAANPRPATKNRLINQVRGLEADFLICDLPSGSGFIALDFFLVAHVGILVVMPEPTSVENTYRFMKSAFLRRLRDPRRLEALRSDRVHEGGIPAPLDLYEEARRLDDAELAQRLVDEMRAFRPRVVVNQTRARSDADLGMQIRSAGRRRLGISLDYLGHVDGEEAVSLAIRRRRPLVVEYPESKATKSIERIVRKLLGADLDRPPPPWEPRPIEEQSPYEVLELDPGASDEDIRRAYKRAREMYASDSMVVCGLFTPERLKLMNQRIEDAHDTLLDPDKRRQTDLRLFPDGVPARPTPVSGLSASASQPVVPAEPEVPRPEVPEPEIGPDTEFTGALLRQVREARGIDLAEISYRTKVGVGHLRSIEDENWPAMPALVYLRGFVIEYARFLKLDATQVSRSYLARYHKAAKAG
jgi:flagellar biosynthesis protein FlhG